MFGLRIEYTSQPPLVADGGSTKGHSNLALSGARTGSAGPIIHGVWLWDVRTGEPRTKLKGHKSNVSLVAFSPDDARIASSSDDDTVC